MWAFFRRLWAISRTWPPTSWPGSPVLLPRTITTTTTVLPTADGVGERSAARSSPSSRLPGMAADSQNVGPPPPQVSAPLPSSAAPEEDEAAQRLRETDFSTETNYAASSLYGRTSRSQFSFQIRFFFSPSHILLLCIVVMDGRLPNKMYKDDTE